MTTTDPLPDILDLRADDPLGEALLLQAVRDGSTAAFGILYARYRSFAVGVAIRALPSADTGAAEDVVEVAFIRVLNALRNGKGPTDTLRPYLTTTVRREVWRAQRRNRRQAEVVDRWASDEDRGLDPEVSPLPLDATDLPAHALLGEAFRGLSDRWRHVLWLTEVEGRKPSEVAPLLGVTAGTASALAYRARNGLVTAYIAAYRRRTTDGACLAISGRLSEYVAAGSPDDGFSDVVAHLEGCASCRDVSRGVDVLGSVLASLAPFGLLTAGLWAKTAGVGAAGLAGAAAAGAAGAAATTSGATAATSTAGGIGVAGGVAAAAAVVVVAAAGWFGLVRSGAEQGAAPPSSTSVASAPAPGAVPADTPRSVVTTVPVQTSVAAAEVEAPGDDRTTTSTSTSASVPAPSTRVPAAPSTTVPVPSTRVPATSSPTTSTSTVVVPPIGDGVLSGRALQPHPAIPDLTIPVDGVGVVAYDDDGQLVATGQTGADGRWELDDLLPGHYLVVAVVPAAYRPASGEDPWTGGATWASILGSVDLGKAPLDLVDLRLVPR